ncbi:site-2 protease family protein [Thermoactinomyces daqus]|uniref:Site-2 protease family protein n=1 Tax=Thermoactinomyces daqus TaxID=1329516 RepID=A0A7W2AID6_9BACL|nr:site-2 protease family protein [Thermoactinomyces daqus]MBA4542758.1 site-2 protease family protein [Thermoactinomyces daqus]MBH8604586.1 site-2 protease family protein [Thermoactinomyces sp. CICC 10522]
MNFSSWLAYPLSQLPFILVTLLIAFTVHEFAHAYTAYRFGDPTAKNEGRLTLNPAAHLDPLGALLVIIAGFGWAKPVPVNRFYLRNRKLVGPLITIAGPLSNLLLAFLSLFIWDLLQQFSWYASLTPNMIGIMTTFFSIMVHFNILLFFFNILPFPPLDGYRFIEDLVSNETRAKMHQYESYGWLLFIILAVTPLGNFVLAPYFSFFIPGTINAMSDWLHFLF